MAETLPSVEDLLGPPPAEELPSAQDLLGPPPTTDEDLLGPAMSQPLDWAKLQEQATAADPDGTAISRVLDAFGQGASDGFGEGPLFDMNIEVAGDAGKALAGVSQSFHVFNDTILKPLAAGLDFGSRVAQAGFYGTLRAGGQAVEEVGLDDADRATRGLMDVATMVSMGAMQPGAALPFRVPMLKRGTLERAEEAGVLKPEPATKPIAPEMKTSPHPDDLDAGMIVAAPASEANNVAGNINLKNINSPEDVKDVIRSTAESRVIAFGDSSPFIDARRGVQSNELTRELAQQVGMTPEKLLERRKGQAFNAEEALASRNLLVQSATEVRDLAVKAQGGDDASLLAFEEAVTRHAAIQEQVAGMTAEAGRALQSFKILAGTDGGQAAAIKAVLEKAGGREKIEAIAQSIATLDPENVGAFIVKARKATTVDMVREAWINGILSAFRTHEANVLGNSLATLTRIPETAGAAVLGALRAGEKVSFRELPAQAVGLVQGAREGLVAAWKALKTGEPSDAVSKMEIQKHRAIPGKIGEVVRLPGRMLMTEDEFFKAVNYRAEINSQAVRKAANEGLTGDAFTKRVGELRANPTDKMIEKARESQLYYSFQTELGPVGKKLMQLRDDIPGGWLVAPFIRTPINIIKFATERSPFGFVMKNVRDNLSGKNGKAARDIQISRMAIGTAVGYATYSAAAEGYISGSGPQDPKERAVLRLSGWQPYSVRIGDKWYSYNRLDPLGLMIGVSADLYEARQMVSKEESEKIGAMLVASASTALLNKTWLSGPASLMSAIQDPDRYGDAWLRRTAGSMVPAAVAQFATESDPVLRDARSTMDAVKLRIPGLSSSVLPKRDIFGEEIRREGTVGGLATPISESTVRRDPVVKELMTLGIFPAPLDRSIRGVELTPEQYDEFQQVAGRFMKITLDQAVTAEGWSDVPAFARQEIISGIITQTRESGRAYMLMKHPEILEEAIKLKTAPITAQ